ncbi:hypothetical protein MUN78_12000 [Leucobacter allii]|uniref:Uncharacterized protein n=1 Tax=Leucobacter allii TaxID=2932247 RepID=A0ABY4FI90_9MICO|nr:hypothetical protein [Leucobacter allii]UOQ56395.1 hypothetical protein MUN78_12000 [Leucobacter allii]
MTEGAAPRRASRRVRRPAPEGVDPRPSEHPLDARAGEDRPEGWGEGQSPGGGAHAHDEELRRDRPPHWG